MRLFRSPPPPRPLLPQSRDQILANHISLLVDSPTGYENAVNNCSLSPAPVDLCTAYVVVKILHLNVHPSVVFFFILLLATLNVIQRKS